MLYVGVCLWCVMGWDGVCCLAWKLVHVTMVALGTKWRRVPPVGGLSLPQTTNYSVILSIILPQSLHLHPYVVLAGTLLATHVFFQSRTNKAGETSFFLVFPLFSPAPPFQTNCFESSGSIVFFAVMPGMKAWWFVFSIFDRCDRKWWEPSISQALSRNGNVFVVTVLQ